MSLEIKEKKYEIWKHGLLDVSKRNKMINYRKTKRATLQIECPKFNELYRRLVNSDEEISFKKAVDCSRDLQLTELFYLFDKLGNPVNITIGEIDTDLNVNETQNTLKNLREKAKLSLEEQGINILYLCFGFIEWRQKATDNFMLSPIVLVPVTLTVDSMTEPYKMKRHDEDIVVNPTLEYLFGTDYGIAMPEFDANKDDLDSYLDEVKNSIKSMGWNVIKEVNLGLLSFLKIVMYKDMVKNKNKIFENPVLNAFCGEPYEIPDLQQEWNDYNHDKELAIEKYQVVNSDSSQQDAILLSKKGVSFILQGPPGTGKSQTITNIIAEGLADKKKILFVSEKMAALSVVYNRLKDVHLTNYCLSLHNYKANKKEVLTDLIDSLDAPAKALNDGVLSFYADFEQEKIDLNSYFDKIHMVIEPLGMTLYDVMTQLSGLDSIDYINFDIPVELTTKIQYQKMLTALKHYRDFVKNYKGYINENPWRNTTLSLVSLEQKNKIANTMEKLMVTVNNYLITTENLNDKLAINKQWSWDGLSNIVGTVEKLYIINVIKNKAKNWFGEAFTTIPTADKLKELIDESNALSGELIRSKVIPNDLDSQKKRNNYIDEWQSIVLKAMELRDFVKDFDKKFGVDFNCKKNDIEDLKNLAKMIMSVEDININWLKDRRLPKVKAQEKSMSDLMDNLHNVRSKIIDDLKTGLRMEESALGSKEGDFYSLFDAEVNDVADRRMTLQNRIKENDTWNKKLIDIGIPEENIENDDIRNSYVEKMKKRIEKITELMELIDAVNIKFGTEYSYTNKELENISHYMKLLMIPYHITDEWIEASNMVMIYSHINKMQELSQNIIQLRDNLLQEWESDILTYHYQDVLIRFKTDYKSFFKRLGSTYKFDKKMLTIMKRGLVGKLDDGVIIEALTKLKEYTQLKDEFEDNKELSIRYFGNYYMALDTDWKLLQDMAKACEPLVKYHIEYGFTKKAMEILTEDFAVRRKLSIKGMTVEMLSEAVNLDKYKELFEENSELSALELQKQCTNKIELIEEYGGYTKKIYEYLIHIMKAEKLILSDSNKQEYINNTVMQVMMEHLKEYYVLRAEYQSNAVLNKDYFENFYQGFATNWEKLKVSLESCTLLYEYQNTKGFSENAFAILGQTVANRSQLQVGSTSLGNLINDKLLNEYIKFLENYSEPIEEVIQVAHNKCQLAEKLNEFWKNVNCRLVASYREKAEAEILDYVKRVYVVIQILNNFSIELHNQLGIQGIQIRQYATWDILLEVLSEFMDCKKDDVDCNRLFEQGKSYGIDTVDEWESIIEEHLNNIFPVLNNSDEYARFAEWFEEKDGIGKLSFSELEKRITACSDLNMLEQWVDFASVLSECHNAGLKEYADYVITHKINTERIIPIYRKSFLIKWVYAILEKDEFAYLRQFKAYAHESKINEFKAHDEKQLLLAQARLDSMLSNIKPSGTRILNNAMDEVSILRRESEKKRKIMPLRKLFKEIPTLLQKLKPCFMMSPLSVSYFLDSDMYTFDMVIFDEASQILPEDAIGAIYRGKQVIIVGDTKQMPPTNFFSSTSNNTDDLYDSEDEEDNFYDVCSESILDEANSCLPSCTLLWHYRSKDESLIAFSNKTIYGGKLITFPNCKKEPDKGLEYDYIQDGYYEGKGKNCNVKEAERCVLLVEEHIKKHPNRSLGIIAFSEKQQGVIEDAVNDFRMCHPEYNDFFDENREEAFFVKNLESVQGDERDTIIFSICYAKNKEGRMYMRFGPLGHAGGERRLNVAITRAKYNVKLVGSILPSDIDLNKTSQEGVKLLRDYILYAMQDDYNMPQGSSESNENEYFTDIISDFIIENGYSVKRNIGASKYKMDIAVVHPDATDEFFVGVECDGGNYIMARTARERDVLRRNIMFSMGWNIYHIWSVAWFRNSVEEKQKLIQFLKDAEQKFKLNKQKQGLKRPIYEKQREEREEFAKMVSETETVSQVLKLEFPEYKVCNPWEAELTAGADNITNVASRIMWVMQHEQPIHKELLYKRLAPIFGREKATEPVRSTIDLAIKSRLQLKVEEKNDFLYYRNTIVRARVPVSDDDIRVIDYICDEEIKDAMIQIVEFALGLNQADLFAEVARTFKFARTGPKIKQSFARAFDDLINEEKLYVVDGKIYRKEA